MLRILSRLPQRTVAKGQALVRAIRPSSWLENYRYQGARDRVDDMLRALARESRERYEGRVLVDAIWDNPNYWARYSLLRSALGLHRSDEVGVLGPFNAERCRRTLTRIGIPRSVSIEGYAGDTDELRASARVLLADTRDPAQILEWKLPWGVPADSVYDGILRRQRGAFVNLQDPRLEDFVVQALRGIAAADALLAAERPSLLVVSHTINFWHTPLVWIAASRGIPVVLLFGHYGVPRFVKIDRPADIYDFVDRPGAAQIEALGEDTTRLLEHAGREYLERRFAGETDDLGALYAFQRPTGRIDRPGMLSRFGWPADRPIVAIHSANWFDFPHCAGMTHFRDFHDWITASLQVARRDDRFSWLLKAHPCDDWYGGLTLQDVVPDEPGSHIRLAPKDWKALDIMNSVDALVTYRGTAGIEFAAVGKPVLVADRGWYHDCGFVRWPKSRESYLGLLGSRWWEGMSLDQTARLARVFAGWYFCAPEWQQQLFLPDDAAPPRAMYDSLHRLLARPSPALAAELAMLKDWLGSPARHYHTFKMARASRFRLADAVA